MTTKRISALAAACVLSLLAACGGSDDGVKLGAFPAITKTEGDAPFELTRADVRRARPHFAIKQRPEVATIAGSVGHRPRRTGTGHDHGAPGQLGSYNPTSTSALLTVKARACATGGGAREWPVRAARRRQGYAAQRRDLDPGQRRRQLLGRCRRLLQGHHDQGTTGWRLPARSDLADLADSGAAQRPGLDAGRHLERDRRHRPTTPLGSQPGDRASTASLMNDNKAVRHLRAGKSGRASLPPSAAATRSCG